MANSDIDFLAPTRVNQLTRKHSDISNNSSEPDSLLELYKSQARNKSVPSGIENGSSKRKGASITSPEENEDNWIHRDKLAQIESRELEEAGFRVPVSRSTSRSAGNSVDKQEYGVDRYGALTQSDLTPAPYAKRDEKRQRIVASVPDEDEEAIMEYDFRTPEEVAAEREAKVLTKAPPRLTGSRLPVAKRSAASAGTSPAEREPSMTRSRRGSATQGNAPDFHPRNDSVESQMAVDQNGDSARPQTPVRGSMSSESQTKASPPGPNAVGKTNTRKTSTTRNVPTTKSRAPSQPKASESPPKRPGTSSGLPRPSTSHRPEGEAPWIASMYKPDPRLPPDQQMLPTHAKRLAQQQWEKEGKIGSVYDTQFRLLNTTELSPPEARSPTKSTHSQASPNGDIQSEKERPAQLSPVPKWPLNIDLPLGSPLSISSRPGTSGTEHGGYSTMPKINTPTPQTAQMSPSKAQVRPIRMEEPPEDEKEKKGLCGCCVVM